MPVVLPAWHDDLHFEAVSSRPAASKRQQNKNIQRLEEIFTDIRPAAKWATSRPAASSSNANSVVKTSSSNGVVKTPSSKNANGDVKAEKVLMFLPDSWPEADLRAEDTVSTAVVSQAPWDVLSSKTPWGSLNSETLVGSPQWGSSSTEGPWGSLNTVAPWGSLSTQSSLSTEAPWGSLSSALPWGGSSSTRAPWVMVTHGIAAQSNQVQNDCHGGEASWLEYQTEKSPLKIIGPKFYCL